MDSSCHVSNFSGELKYSTEVLNEYLTTDLSLMLGESMFLNETSFSRDGRTFGTPVDSVGNGVSDTGVEMALETRPVGSGQMAFWTTQAEGYTVSGIPWPLTGKRKRWGWFWTLWLLRLRSALFNNEGTEEGGQSALVFANELGKISPREGRVE